MIEKKLNELYNNLPMDLNVIEINDIQTLSNGAVVVDLTYPMKDDDFTETLCFNSNLSIYDVLKHLEERVMAQYASLDSDEYVRDKLNEFFKLISELLQTL